MPLLACRLSGNRQAGRHPTAICSAVGTSSCGTSGLQINDYEGVLHPGPHDFWASRYVIVHAVQKASMMKDNMSCFHKDWGDSWCQAGSFFHSIIVSAGLTEHVKNMTPLQILDAWV